MPGLFRLSTAVPSAMTIVPESGRLESIPGCRGLLLRGGRGALCPGSGEGRQLAEQPQPARGMTEDKGGTQNRAGCVEGGADSGTARESRAVTCREGAAGRLG